MNTDEHINMEFFRMAASAAFANPFSGERVESDRRIVGASTDADWEEMHEPLFRALQENIEALQSVSRRIAGRESDEDSRAVAVSVLFYVFTQYQFQFDDLIERQIKAGDESIEAPFALECLQRLAGYGFPRSEACRYVGIFYQVRRAYYFIKRLIGDSRCMKNLRAQLWNNVFTHDVSLYEQALWDRMEDFSTLLLGETGTGKGAAAAAIGRSGCIPFSPKTKRFQESFTRAFVAINLSQYPESLIESELFGHRKGAFTGAVERHDGIFSRCSPHGAIFLDEIGEVAVPIQIKLLQVLQERTFSPVGSHEKLRFEGRVIAATNRQIDDLRREGKFRDDFYYRLCSDLITVPPLRQRIAEMPDELEQLAAYLMDRIGSSTARFPIIAKLRECVGRDYAWPGNVRELEQAIRRIMLSGAYEAAEAQPPADLTATSMTARELVQKYCRDLYDLHGSYGEVARRTDLDWRTVKRHVMGD